MFISGIRPTKGQKPPKKEEAAPPKKRRQRTHAQIYLDLVPRGEKLTPSELDELTEEVIKVGRRESHIGLPVKGKVVRLETSPAWSDRVCLKLVEQPSFDQSMTLREEYSPLNSSELRKKLTVLLGQAGVLGAA